MKSDFYDVVIIGGGASGLICSAVFAQKNPDKNVLVIEKQSRVGKKLLATGNGKCNLTNLSANCNNYHGSFNTKHILNIISPTEVIEYFKSIGLLCVSDGHKRIYPRCKQASAVLDILRLANDKTNITIICECNVINIKKQNDQFITYTDKANYLSDKIVIASGGKASPSLGGNSNCLDILKNMGHKIVKPLPCLLPIDVDSPIIKSLKGIRVDGQVSLIDNMKTIAQETGEIQFGEKHLSGICVFNLTSYIHKINNPKIKISLLPEMNQNEIFDLLYKQSVLFYDKPIEDIFIGIVNKRIGIALLKECNIGPMTIKISALKKSEIAKLANIVNNWTFTAYAPKSFEKAQVTSGGIYGNEIDENSMESKIINGLYICGEAVDTNGDCGGFNLQFAFSSGILTGENL